MAKKDESVTKDTAKKDELVTRQIINGKLVKVPVTTSTEDDNQPVPPQGPEVPVESLETDYGNALRIEFYFRENIAYWFSEKIWLRWVDTHWNRDTNLSIVKLVVDAIRNISSIEIPWLKYKHDADNKSGYQYELVLPGYDWIVDSLSRSKIKAAAELATSLLPLEGDLDSHPFLLNVQNGTINLKTGELLPHRREDFITKIAPVNYNKEAKSTEFRAFLNRAFPGDQVGIKFIQKMFGYALTGDVSEKRFYILWGAAGNNGKTLLFNVIRAILGACFRIQLASESLVSGRLNSIRSDLAKLKGYRFVTASETDKKYKFNEALIKLLTGGDTLTARHPHEKEIEFNPELKLFLATNAKPEFSLSDKAMMNRVCIIPFRVSIPPEEQNKNLTQELIREESEGILAWLVEGARMWAEEGLGENPFNVEDYAIIKRVVTLEQFFNECCDRTDRNAKTVTSELLAAYNAYKESVGDESPDSTDKQFGEALNDAGIDSKKTSQGTMRLGIRLNEKGKLLLEKKPAADGGTTKPQSVPENVATNNETARVATNDETAHVSANDETDAAS